MFRHRNHFFFQFLGFTEFYKGKGGGHIVPAHLQSVFFTGTGITINLVFLTLFINPQSYLIKFSVPFITFFDVRSYFVPSGILKRHDVQVMHPPVSVQFPSLFIFPVFAYFQYIFDLQHALTSCSGISADISFYI